ncbi:MAG: hypothetical protein EOL88_15030 [Bacteroidia bacterium]|nr:hypothetical protein [Bacteroidia bacterium]
MKELIQLIDKLIDARVIKNYAVFGAVAQMRYTEAVVTLDADILIAIDNESIAVLSPIYKFCEERGYLPEGEAIRVGAWPVQFIPAFDKLSEAAMDNAVVADMDGLNVRVVRADYLAVMALSVGRAKDRMRILALLEAEAITESDIEELATKYGLDDKWSTFKERFLDEN